MDRWHAMQVFVRVADGGGFAEAARQLHTSASAVTRTIAALETAIGARLFIRTTRAVKLTEAGSRYLQDCRRILDDIQQAEAAATGAFVNPSGTLTVTASVMFGHKVVMPIFRQYLERNPAVIGRTLFFDRITHIVDEDIDVAIRIGHLPDSGLRAIQVGSVRRIVCGAPAYFKERGVPLHPADLERHAIIATTSAWTSLDWAFGGDPPVSVSVRPRLFCNTNEAAIGSALDGWGLTRVPSYQIAALLEQDRLRAVLCDFEEPPLPVHIVHSEGRHAAAKVRSFVHFAAAALRENRLIN